MSNDYMASCMSIPSVRLPVVDALLATANLELTQHVLKKTLIYYVHHPLQTSINVIDSLVQLGASYCNIFVLGKSYSQCDAVVSTLIKRGVHYQASSMQGQLGQFAKAFIRDINVMWFKLLQHLGPEIENILVLDHGGHAISFIPPEILEQYRVIGIEKTSAGLFDLDKRGTPLFPVIDVASCAAKRHLESPLIAKAVVDKLFSQLSDPCEGHYGVVGLGAVGRAIVERLIALGEKPLVFDTDHQIMLEFTQDPRVLCAHDSRDLIAVCDWVFGCSGRDISETALNALKLSPRDKTFISCSSEDKEFLSLLRFIGQQNTAVHPLDTLDFQSKLGATIRLLRGGFPANFDHSGESVPAHQIQLTRALVLAAVLQAVDFFMDDTLYLDATIHPLNWNAQLFIVSEWLQYQNRIEQEECLLEKWTKLLGHNVNG